MLSRAEVLGPAEGLLTIIVAPNPFLPSRDRRIGRVAAGLTVAEIVEAAWPGRDPALIRATLGDHGLPRAGWSRVRPKPGTILLLRPALQGKSAALIGVAIAAIAAAIFVPYLLPAGLPLFGALSISAATLGSFAAAAVTIGGTLAVNALFPVPAPKLAPAREAGILPSSSSSGDAPGRKTLSSIAGAQNQQKPFGTVPLVLGRHRLSPPYAARPFTELIGEDQYVTMLFCVGYGPVSITDERLGETAIAAFPDRVIEHFAGLPGDGAPTLYPGQVTEEPLQIELIGGDVPFVRTTEPDTDEIVVDISAPSGVFYFDKTTGAYNAYSVRVSIQIRLLPAGAFFEVASVLFQRELDAARRGVRVPVSRGQYEVQLSKQAPDAGSSEIRETVYWTALRSVKRESPVAFDEPLCLVSARFKASGVLSGPVATYNLVAQGLYLAFNGVSWVANQPSSNPADLIRHVLQGPANKRPVADAAIDLESLQDFWRYCDDEGWTYDAVIEEPRSVLSLVYEIAAAGRAVPVFRDGRWAVIWEDWSAPVVQSFMPRNSSGFSAAKSFRRMPHGWRVRFINAAKGWVEDERIVYDDGYSAGTATLFEAIEFPGVTDAGSIWRLGRYHIAQARLRPETVSLTVDWEGLAVTRGDRVRVAHDVMLIGQAQARVLSLMSVTSPVLDSSGDVIGGTGGVVTLDELVIMEAGKSYVLRFRKRDLSDALRPVLTVAGETTSLTFSGTGELPRIGDLAMFGEGGIESAVYRVSAIAHSEDLKATLTLVDDAPGIADADVGAIPAFDSHVSAPIDPYSLPPGDLRVTEILDGSGGAKRVVLRLSWTAPRLARVTRFEAEVEEAGVWGRRVVVAAPQQHAEWRDLLIGTYSFRVRSVFDDGASSSWAALDDEAIVGRHLSSPLPNVTEMRTSFVDGILNITWDEIDDFREVFYEIRKGETWDSALFVGTLAHPPFPTVGDDTYWVSAVSRPIAGLLVYSEAPQALAVTGSLLVRNVVAVRDEKAADWPGLFSGTVAKSGDLIRTGGSGDVLGEPDLLGIPDLVGFGGSGDGSYEIGQASWIDAGRITAAKVVVTWRGTGVRSLDGSFDPSVPGDAADLVEVYPEIALSQSEFPGDVYGIPDPYAPTDIYGQVVVWDDWQKYAPGVYLGRLFKARLVLKTHDPTVIAVASDFALTVDVADRVDHIGPLDLPAAGQPIEFTPDGAGGPLPFLGGPNGSSEPFVAVTVLDPQPGDQATIRDLTPAGCSVRVLNGVAGVARRVTLTAQGY